MEYRDFKQNDKVESNCVTTFKQVDREDPSENNTLAKNKRPLLEEVR